MSKPTKDDANLMIQLMRWGAAEGLQDAMNWIWSDEFISDYDEFIAKYPRGSNCLLYTSPSPRDATLSRMPSSA